MSTQTQFESGQFVTYRATTKIHLGSLESDIYEGDLVLFDGQTLVYGGQKYNLPQLRAGIKKGWLVPPEDNVTRYIPQPAGVLVRPAESAGNERGAPMPIETAYEEEQVVGTLEAHQERRKKAARSKPQRVTRKQAAPGPVPASTEKGLSHLDGLTPEEIAAVERANEINRRRIAEAQAQLPEEDPEEEGLEVEEEDLEEEESTGKFQVVQASSGQAVGKYKFGGGAKVGSPGDKSLRESVDVTKARSPKERPVAPKRTPKKSTGAREGETLAELLPDAAVGSTGEPQVQWDKSGHWRTRVKTAVERYGDNPAALAQIKRVETPSVVKHIDAALEKR